MIRHAGSGGAVAGDAFRGGALAGVNQNDATGLDSMRVWVREDLRTMRDPPVCSGR